MCVCVSAFGLRKFPLVQNRNFVQLQIAGWDGTVCFLTGQGKRKFGGGGVLTCVHRFSFLDEGGGGGTLFPPAC